MLNLVCHLSGIATATAAWVDAVEGTKHPGHPKDAAPAHCRSTRCASARVNHRMGLGDTA